MSDEEHKTIPPEAPLPEDTAREQEAPLAAGPGQAEMRAASELPKAEFPEAPSPAPEPEPAASKPPVATSTVVPDDRLMAALAWFSMAILQIPAVSVVLLLVEPNKNRPFQRYHAVTSTLFWGAAIVYEILAVIVYTILAIITLGCLAFFLWVIFFLPHIAALYYAYQAYQGHTTEIPFISEFARKQGWA